MPNSSSYVAFLSPAAFQEKGYRCSNLITENIIQGAERAVVDAYLVPIVGVPDSAEPEVRDVVAALTYFELTLKNIFQTSTGAEKKRHEYGYDPSFEDTKTEMCNFCAYKLLKFIEIKRIDRKELKKCDDICGIFYKTNFFW